MKPNMTLPEFAEETEKALQDLEKEHPRTHPRKISAKSPLYWSRIYPYFASGMTPKATIHEMVNAGEFPDEP